MELHALVKPLSFLIGTWEGEGRGHFPTIDDFRYSETLTFGAVPGKPFLRYEQKTAGPNGPMHTELGFLRPGTDGHIEFVIAQPTGQTELLEGTVKEQGDGTLTISFPESVVANTSTAKTVDAAVRTYVISADRTGLHTKFDMEAVGQSMQQHLVSDLRKA